MPCWETVEDAPRWFVFPARIDAAIIGFRARPLLNSLGVSLQLFMEISLMMKRIAAAMIGKHVNAFEFNIESWPNMNYSRAKAAVLSKQHFGRETTGGKK